MQLRAMLMNQSVVPLVGRQDGQGGIAQQALGAQDPDNPCSPLPVPNVAKKLEYRSSQKKVDQFIAVIAIARPDLLANVKFS